MNLPFANPGQKPSIPTPIEVPKRLLPLIKFCGRTALTFGLALTLISTLNAQEKSTQYWQGTLDVGGAKLTLNVEIKGEETGPSAIVYAVEQGNAEIPASKVEMSGEKIMLELDSIQASFEGTLDESGDVCQGAWSQGGAKLDLELRRVKSFKEETSELIEYWRGTLDGTDLEMGLKVFQMEDGSLTAKLDSYAQGVTDLPVEFERDGNDYQVSFPGANLEFSGTLDPTTEKISGTLTQHGNETALEFAKANFDEIPTYKRPQTPQAPLPYDSEEVSFENSGDAIRLAGTLTLPPGDGPFPVAITISGSGASDRDESNFEHKPFLIIADHLARQGIAVLRYDDRGVGESTGKYTGATSADLATDVEAGIDFLKKHPKIDASRIGLIGHSEGGLIAPMVAAKRDDVHFIVLLAGTGVDGGVILKSQSTAMLEADGESEEMLDANRKVHEAILSLIKNDPDVTHEELETASNLLIDSCEDEDTRKLMEPMAKQLVAMLNSRWVGYFVRHDPVETLNQVKCHVLAMNGEKDLQVLCDLNLIPIENALREGSPASFEIVRLPNTNHMFQETDGSGSPSEYGTIEETFSPKALKRISDWLKKVAQ